MTVIRELDAIVRKAMRGAVVRTASDGPSVAAQCAFRICRLSDEEADVRGLLGLIQHHAKLCWAELLSDSVVKVLCTTVSDVALVAIEGALETLSAKRQSNLFALAIVVWSISEAKEGAVDAVSEYTPGLDRVLNNIAWLFNKDSWGADNRQIVEAVTAAVRENTAIWQIKGLLNKERSGE